MKSSPPLINALIGITLLVVAILIIITEWTGNGASEMLASIGVILFVGLATPYVAMSRMVFVIVGVAMLAFAVGTRPDWASLSFAALKTAAFIAAFFTALTSLRNASASSPSIAVCGNFLAEQPPGRRYAALTVGGHLFALVLNYGAISLLGSLAEASVKREPNSEIRSHRTRRMLLAIQRGFVSTLPWSPLTFAVAISTSLVPGADWIDAVGYCVVSALILAGLGWLLDTIFKPRLSVPVPQRQKSDATWATLLPLILLLSVLIGIVGTLVVFSGVRIVGVVMFVVPVVSIGWVALQNIHDAPFGRTRARIWEYLVRELPGYRSELVLLVMAGFIGTLGAKLLAPIVVASGLSLTGLPGWVVLVALVWLIPISGQLGMNPILSVSLLAPLLPSPAAIGVSPAAVLAALTAGWALSGASSPYTATTLLVGSIARVSPWRVGLGWNGAYTIICALALSAWITVIARWL